MKRSPLTRLCLSLALLLSLVLPARATWSIVAVNRATGEVAVACATCLVGTDLKAAVPVIVVGRGAAAAQSFVDLTGMNRMLLNTELRDRLADPATILTLLEAQDMGHQTRQYGIASLFGGPPVTFTGTGAGLAASGVTGQVGDYVYAIQGNVLTDDAVVLAAEAAFRDTDGDMGQRLMAGMQAAKALGGDGRCSCSQNEPTACGAPPPNFTKSAHVGFLVIARMGDRNGACNANRGCAQGTYYFCTNVQGQAGQPASIDPVDRLQIRYDSWRSSQAGRPDGVLSTFRSVQSIPADGLTQRTATIQLVDLDGVPLTAGGATVEVNIRNGAAPKATYGPVVDNGDGTYSFSITAGTTPGSDPLEITADDGTLKATLFPFPFLINNRVEDLHCGFSSISAAEGDKDVPLQFNVGARPYARYVLFASLTGTRAGQGNIGGLLPLNPPLFSTLAGTLNPRTFSGAVGRLDDLGRAEATLALDSESLGILVGQRVDIAALVVGRGGLGATNVVGFDVTP